MGNDQDEGEVRWGLSDRIFREGIMSIRSVASRLVWGRYCRSIAAAVLVCMLSVIAGEAPIACTNTTVPSGNITYAYDVNGRLTGVVNASGRAATYMMRWEMRLQSQIRRR